MYGINFEKLIENITNEISKEYGRYDTNDLNDIIVELIKNDIYTSKDSIKHLIDTLEDLQGGEFAVGRVATIKEWKEIALEWCESDNNEEYAKFIKRLPQKDIIGEIASMWDLEIKPITELDIERMFELVDHIMYYKLPLQNLANILNESHRKNIEEILEKAEFIYKQI